MSAQHFQTVRIEEGRTGQIRHVSSIEEAAECLMGRWPIREGRTLEAAKAAILAAYDGVGDVQAARDAFAAAAAEAGILLPDLPSRQSAMRTAVAAHKHRVLVGVTKVKNDRLMTRIEIDGKNTKSNPG